MGDNLDNMMGSLANYFDYETYARKLFNWDYNMGAHRLDALFGKETATCSVESDPRPSSKYKSLSERKGS